MYYGLTLVLIIVGCNNVSHNKINKNELDAVKSSMTSPIYYRSLSGEKYLAQGGFLKNSNNYKETNLWVYTNMDRPLVLSGHYLNGFQNGEWNFILGDGTQMSSQWDIYNNKVTPCSFSLPFKYEEMYIDSFSLNLKTMNDSLGKIGIMVQIRDTTLNEENLVGFTMKPDKELKDQGYTFTNNKREIEKDKNRYFFYEYFLRDSVNQEAEVYYFFGNTLSKKHFVLFTLFHQGPRVDLVKIICNLLATSLYVDNERFYNPYQTNKDE